MHCGEARSQRSQRSRDGFDEPYEDDAPSALGRTNRRDAAGRARPRADGIAGRTTFVASRAADFKVPAKILFMDEIPKGATGKLQRIGLAQKLGLA